VKSSEEEGEGNRRESACQVVVLSSISHIQPVSPPSAALETEMRRMQAKLQQRLNTNYLIAGTIRKPGRSGRRASQSDSTREQAERRERT
jgi:hypothetical protein